jgi:hypothetical protein
MKGKLYQEERFSYSTLNLSFLFPAVFSSKRKSAKIELVMLSVENIPFLKDEKTLLKLKGLGHKNSSVSK